MTSCGHDRMGERSLLNGLLQWIEEYWEGFLLGDQKDYVRTGVLCVCGVLGICWVCGSHILCSKICVPVLCKLAEKRLCVDEDSLAYCVSPFVDSFVMVLKTHLQNLN